MENKEPKRVRFHRIVPQMKTFTRGTLLKNKVDLYYSLEEDIVETGQEDDYSPIYNLTGNHQSFSSSGEFICKDTMLLFVEAAQFNASDGNVYVRLQMLANEKVVWVNLLKVPNRVWSFKIRQEQKTMIKEEIEKMFEITTIGSN
jgi:hypothetical protein